MANTGVKGFDMYCRGKGSHEEMDFAKVFIPKVNPDTNSYTDSYEFKTRKL